MRLILAAASFAVARLFARSDQALDVFGYYGAVRSDADPGQGNIDEILGLAEKEPETLLLFSGLKVGRSAGLLAFDVVQVAGIQLLAQLLDALLRLITKVQHILLHAHAVKLHLGRHGPRQSRTLILCGHAHTHRNQKDGYEGFE